MRVRLFVGVLLILSLAGVAQAGVTADSPRSELVYPLQEIPLTFSHKLHIEGGAQCVLCHSAVSASTRPEDHNIPTHMACAICHRMESPDAAKMYPKSGCEHCHAGFEGGTADDLGPAWVPKPEGKKPPPVQLPPAKITFAHKTHIDRGIECLTCHVDVDIRQLATREDLPHMGICLGCHDGRKASDACATCHLQGDDGLLASRLAEAGFGSVAQLQPSGRFRPDDHFDPTWYRGHESAARADGDSCENCHEASSCLDCHDGIVKNQVLHPADWVMTHGVEALRKDINCQSCHEPKSFCNDCHQTAGVVPGRFPSPAGDPPGQQRFHPVGWGGGFGQVATEEHHSHQARRSLEICQTCHEESFCQSCHSFVNPHPASWAEDTKWRFGQGDGQVCLRCHPPGAAVLGNVGR